jgi:hypothetical protein
MHRSKQHHYSITSSASASSVGGMSRPSVLAVRALITNSNRVGCSTGKSDGSDPLRILSTNVLHARDGGLGQATPPVGIAPPGAAAVQVGPHKGAGI